MRIKSPEGMQDDFKQEVFMVLLEMDEREFMQIYRNEGLIWYTSRIILNLSTKSGSFYRKYRDIPVKVMGNIVRAYIAESCKGYDIPKFTTPALKVLSKKESGTAEEWHEAQIFKHYINERSYERVAEFYGLPYHHVNKVVLKVRKELLKSVKNAC